MDPKAHSMCEVDAEKLRMQFVTLQVNYQDMQEELNRRTEELEQVKNNGAKELAAERMMSIQREYNLRRHISKLSMQYRELQQQWFNEINNVVAKLRAENNALRSEIAQSTTKFEAEKKMMKDAFQTMLESYKQQLESAQEQIVNMRQEIESLKKQSPQIPIAPMGAKRNGKMKDEKIKIPKRSSVFKYNGNINNNNVVSTASSALPVITNEEEPKPQKPKRRKICTDEQLNRCLDDDEGMRK